MIKIEIMVKQFSTVTRQSSLLEPPPLNHVMGEGANSNNNNPFASELDGSPAPGLEGGGGSSSGGGEGMLLQGGEKDAGFIPMENVGDGGVQIQADLWG